MKSKLRASLELLLFYRWNKDLSIYLYHSFEGINRKYVSITWTNAGLLLAIDLHDKIPVKF